MIGESMRNRFDRASMLQASKSPKSDTASRISGLLAGLTLVAFGALLCLIVIKAYDKKIDSVPEPLVIQISVKSYAAQQIGSIKQYKCLSKLYGKESAWNPDAVSGSHYGIPQLKNKLMIGLSPYRQIDYGLKYIAHRYKLDEYGYINACKAWEHWQRKNWH